MKAKYLICCTTLIALSPLSCMAGLSLSDAPMFVTEPLLPNVVISPVFTENANELVLKDVPWNVYGDLLFRNGSSPWYVPMSFMVTFPFRVTPWPKTVAYPGDGSTVADCSRTTNVKFPCSDVDLYHDFTVGTSFSGTINNLLGYSFNPSGSISTLASTRNNYLQEFYPQPGSPSDTRYDHAKSRYFRSDNNYLYYSESAAGEFPSGKYERWPALGGDEFITYADATAAQTARYSPLLATAGTVDLGGFIDNFMFERFAGSGTIPYPALVNYPAYIGQYWKKTGTDVTLPASFEGHCWSSTTATQAFGCTVGMNETKKVSFANWFTYWRSSGLANRGMLGSLFSRLDEGDILHRFRYAFAVQDQSTGVTGIKGLYVMDNEPGATKAEKRAALLSDIRGIIYSDSKQFVNVWDYTRTKTFLAADAAYRDNVGAPLRSCRRNYEILITPDYTNLSYAGAQAPRPAGNEDNHTDDNDTDEENHTIPYKSPSGVAHEGMWSDLGALGWYEDLRPGTGPGNDNNILKSLRDPATWQHIVRYIIGPNSSRGVIFPAGEVAYGLATEIAQAATDAGTWPARPAINSNEAYLVTTDDLWQMALNSRGFFFPSNNVTEAVDSLVNTFNEVLVRNVSGSAVATNTSSLSQGGKIYQAMVESDWKGHLRAYSVITGTILQIDYRSELWDLAEKVSAQADAAGWHTGRKIATYYNASGVPFRWADIGNTAQGFLKTAVPAGITDADAYGGKLLDYLRGSGDCEDLPGINCVSGVSYTFRRRNIDRTKIGPYTSSNANGRNVLGDIANSNPWLVSPPPAGRSDVDFPNYNAFRVTNKTRRNVLYVGANDGMLHAVDTSDGADKGKELFAYIPSFVQTNLYQLASSSYSHKFFVDGSPFSADVDLGGWKTVLAGGANKGGKGYYLLDVTNPTANTEATAGGANGWVKWEFTHPRDLHYTFNLPVADSHGQARQIVRMNDGNLALIVGNGYPEDADKRACLFILYLSGPGADAGDAAGVDYHGTGYHKLCAGATTYATDGGLDTNGLSTPFPVDLTGDGKVDFVYAGDLNGNMWKFDVASVTPANWVVAYSLFVAKNAASPAIPATETTPAIPATLAKRQPIITPPELILHSEGTTSGPLVLFGTGKYIDGGADGVGGDRANTDVQSFYGVWDRGLSGITRGNLFAQSFDEVTSSSISTVVNGETVVQLLSQPIRKQDPPKPQPTYCSVGDATACTTDHKHLGWFWDMPTSGERLTGKMSLINGVVAFSTFFPATETYVEGDVTKTRLDPCQYGGDGWLMGLNAVNGYMEDQFSVFDVNQDGVINDSDARSAGIKVGAMMGGATFAKGIGTTYVGVGAATNVSHTTLETPPVTSFGTAGSGRVSWFELLD